MPEPTDRPSEGHTWERISQFPFVDKDGSMTHVAFSADVVSQSLESLFVYLDEQGAHELRPIHADALRVGWDPSKQPGDIVASMAHRYGLVPILVHSTSWRFEEGRVVLTYLAAVEPPDEPNAYLLDEPVQRADLARGDAMGPPPEIGMAQVIEHAFRHLSWLVKDDQAVHDALPEWVDFLSFYEPEPFRSFGAPG